LILNATYSQYDVLKDVAKDLQMKVIYEDDDGQDWDVLWQDGSIVPSIMMKLEPYQRVNHFPGMYVLARKNNLAKNLAVLRKNFSHEFSFYPRTWVLPQDAKDFKQ